jgi:hypothetical protein
MEKISNERLLKLACHLEALETYDIDNNLEIWLQWPQDNCDVWYAITYNPSYYKQFPEWFKEWQINEEFDEPTLKEDKNLSFSRCCLKFFSLGPIEFTHLFDMRGYQNTDKYGGKYLHLNSNPSTIANNIKDFVGRR